MSPVPVAVTENVAVVPAHTVAAAGWVVIAGAAFTVSAAAVDVTDGEHVPLTTTW